VNAGVPKLKNRRVPTGALVNPVFAVLLLFGAVPETAHAALPPAKSLITPDARGIEDPDPVVQRYLDAVDRGELVIFGQTLARSMLIPARVEYVYELSNRTTRIKVYSDLKEPLAVPDQPDCKVLGVSAVLEDGIITEIESHVWIKP
jgi:hypothetical protein